MRQATRHAPQARVLTPFTLQLGRCSSRWHREGGEVRNGQISDCRFRNAEVKTLGVGSAPFFLPCDLCPFPLLAAGICSYLLCRSGGEQCERWPVSANAVAHFAQSWNLHIPAG